VPAVNPFIDPGINLDAIDGSPVNFAPSPYTLRQQDPRPAAAQAGRTLMSPWSSASTSQVNAAGTSENVAMHVAVIVALALVGVYVFRQSGFKFAVAGSLGG
jgi:hypothetical protein